MFWVLVQIKSATCQPYCMAIMSLLKGEPMGFCFVFF